MKQNYFLKIALLFFLFTGLNYGQTTVTYDFSSGGAVSGLNETSPGISIDANIGFGSFKNSGTSNPGVFSGQLRLYQNATKGGSIIIYANNGVTITEVIVRASSRTGPAGFDADGVFQSNLSGGSTYTMSSLSATSNVEFFQRDSSSSNRIYVDEIEITYTSGGTATPGISLSSVSGNTNETGTTATFTAVLNAAPTSDVVIDVTSGDTGEVTVSPSALTFTNANWDQTQTITATGVNDALNDDNVDVTITLAVDDASSDDDYDGISTTTTVTNEDDDLPVIIISEIMYNTPSTDDEWIEVYNGNGADVDISSWTVVYSGGTFTFPGSTTITDGDYITIALGSNGDGTYNNDNPFTPDFNDLTGSPSNANVKDTNDSNNLGNSSGTITLKNSSGTSIDVVAYDDGDASSTDGNGPSYEILDTTSDNSNTNTNWQASALNGGSPGKLNSTTWSGATNNDWNTTSNWSNGIPVTTSDLLIPASLTNYPTASGAITVNTAVINSGASLIAQSTFAGAITYKRTLATTNWYLISSPVEGQDIDTFVAAEGLASGTNGSNLGLSDYNNATPGWTFYQSGASGTGSFTSGDGRSIKLASTGDVSFTGTINTSDVTVAMTSNSNGFNLVGNPYPSYVAGNENADGSNNILTINSANLTENTLWFWNQSTDSYNQINHASSAKHIAPGQGFFLSATGSVNLSITEAMQSHQGTDSFQRLTTRPEIELTLSNDSAIRHADIYYIEGTTTGWDNGYDSSIFGGVTNEFAIYTHAVANGNGRNLGIQSLPPNNYENMIIPVGINAEAGTAITIDVSTINFPSGINIYLEDKQDNSFTLLNTDANFSTTLENSLSGIGRFYLHTTSGVLSAPDFDINTNVSIYTSSNDNLRIVGAQKGTATVQLYNILGREVFKTSFEGNGVNDINLNNIPVGIYIVKLATENGTLNRKIIIQ